MEIINVEYTGESTHAIFGTVNCKLKDSIFSSRENVVKYDVYLEKWRQNEYSPFVNHCSNNKRFDFGEREYQAVKHLLIHEYEKNK